MKTKVGNSPSGCLLDKSKWKAVEPQPGVFDDSYLSRYLKMASETGSHVAIF